MTARLHGLRPGQVLRSPRHAGVAAARWPRGAVAAVAVLAFLLLVLAPGPAAPAGLTGVAVPGAVAASAVSADPSGVRPAADDAYMGSSPVVLRPPRDAGERSVPAGPLLFTPPYTPAIPPRPAPPAPVHGNAPPDAAHLPGDLGRAPPAASST